MRRSVRGGASIFSPAPSMTRKYVSLADGLSRIFGFLSVLLLVAAMLVVCQMIVLRYFFRQPTIWQVDFVVYAATASIFLGSPYVLMKKAHVNVDVVENILSGDWRAAQRFIGRVLGLIFCLVMFAASVNYLWEAVTLDWQTNSIWQIPLWIPIIPMPIGFGLLCVQYLAEFLRPKDETS
jgi:TRAP-type C4-dicarboxylate transport system permease small subunit